jgi:hypothetical protein
MWPHPLDDALLPSLSRWRDIFEDEIAIASSGSARDVSRAQKYWSTPPGMVLTDVATSMLSATS